MHGEYQFFFILMLEVMTCVSKVDCLRDKNDPYVHCICAHVYM